MSTAAAAVAIFQDAYEFAVQQIIRRCEVVVRFLLQRVEDFGFVHAERVQLVKDHLPDGRVLPFGERLWQHGAHAREPRMLADHVDCEPLLRIRLENPSDQILHRLGHRGQRSQQISTSGESRR